MTNEFVINILEQYRKKPTLVNEIETVEEAVWLDKALDMAIKALEQETRKGHWEHIKDKFGRHLIICEYCKYTEPECITFLRNYCPNCGCRMVEPKESEEV